MSMTSNPIELLMSLDVNRGRSQQNIDQYVQALKKYYDKNPLLISVGIDSSGLKASSKDIEELQKQVSKLKNQLSSTGSNKSASSETSKVTDMYDKQVASLGKLSTELYRIEKMLPRAMDKSKVAELKSEIDKLKNIQVMNPASLKQNQREINALRESIKRLNIDARDASKSTNELGNAFSTAFTKFPIWMLASTAFYAPIRGIQDMTERTIELDSALIGLARVMNAPEYQFNEMIEKSLVNVRELSGVTTEYLEILNEFARMGYNASDSLDLTNTAQMFTNISDLNAKESVDTLVAGQLAFNVAAEDSIRIADALNEVDNNFSITTKDLALSMGRAAQSAKAYGVSMEELVGYTTAIGAATRESGNVVG